MGVETDLETEGVAVSIATGVCVGLDAKETSRLSGMQPVAIRTGSATAEMTILKMGARLSHTAVRLRLIEEFMGL